MNNFAILLAVLLALKLSFVGYLWWRKTRDFLIGVWVPAADLISFVKSVEFTELPFSLELGSLPMVITEFTDPADNEIYGYMHRGSSVTIWDLSDDVASFRIDGEFIWLDDIKFVKLKPKKPMKKLWPFAFILALFCASCETIQDVGPRPPDETNIVGEWRWVNPANPANESVLQFKDDGTVNIFYETREGNVIHTDKVGIYEYYTRPGGVMLAQHPGPADTYAQKGYFRDGGLYLGGLMYFKTS